MTYRKLLEALKELTDYQLDNFDVTIVDSGLGEAYGIEELSTASEYKNFNFEEDTYRGRIANAISSLDSDDSYPVIIIGENE